MADSFSSSAANKPMGHVHTAALPVGVPENHTFQHKIDAILKKDDETAKRESNDPVNLYQPSLYGATGNK